MKSIALGIVILVLFLRCKTASFANNADFKLVSVDTILNDKISIRAIIVDKNKIWYAADNSRIGYYDFKTFSHLEIKILNSDKLEFRSIAQNSKNVFIANIGNPAFIYKVDKSDTSIKNVYTENNDKAFYDSMNFWNEKEGITMGDPTDNCFSVLITRNGGKTWKKTVCNNLPKVADGEAAFAASNTNICIKGNNTWLVSGGKKARVFYSADKGNSWEVFNTPIVQGQAMTGIFTADFYNAKIGVIAGGNYEIPNQNFQNKAITFDGGRNWKLLSENKGFGYTSCIQFVPKSNGKQLVAVGTSGVHYSSDGGITWKQLLSDKTLYTIRFLNESTAFAAGRDKIVKITFKK